MSDRAKAADLIYAWDDNDSGTYDDLADLISAALADERAQARADTYRAVADECDRVMPELDWGDHFRAIAAQGPT